MSLLVALIVGGLVFAAVQLGLSSARRRDELKRRLAWYGGSAGPRPERSAESVRVRATRLLETALEQAGLTRRISRALGRAGIDRSPVAFCGLVLAAGAALVLLALLAAGKPAAIAAALATPFVAMAVLSVLAKRRAKAFEALLPELLDSLSAGLKAGHGFDHALNNAANDSGEPVASELKRVIAEVHLGRPLESALAELGERVKSKDLLFVLNAITVQRQVGGSLAELFKLVAETVRQREQFRRKLRAITGMPRVSAKLLSAMPLAVALLLSVANREYIAPLVTTSSGRILSVVTLVMMGIGSWMLRKIGSVQP